MDYKQELERINDKYYNKIKCEYGKYVKNIDKIPDMTKKVYIIPLKKCVREYEDLQKHTGICLKKNGRINIREESFNEHLLVHEYIHRISRRFRRKGFKWEWVEGIDYTDTGICYTGLNEVLTEYLAVRITGKKMDKHPYQMFFCLIECLIKKNGFNYICENYFQNNGTYFRERIEEIVKYTKYNAYGVINLIDESLASNKDDTIAGGADDVKEILKVTHL